MATDKPSCVMRALFDHAELMATTGPQLPVSFPEQDPPFDRPADLKFLDVQHFPNKPAWQGLAGGVMDQGLLQIDVHWPKGAGLIAPTAKVALVKAHFALGTRMFHGGFSVRVTSQPWHAPAMTEPDTVKIPVLIPWKA